MILCASILSNKPLMEEAAKCLFRTSLKSTHSTRMCFTVKAKGPWNVYIKCALENADPTLYLPCTSFHLDWYPAERPVPRDLRGSGWLLEICLDRRRRLRGCGCLHGPPRRSCTLRHWRNTSWCEREPKSIK